MAETIKIGGELESMATGKIVAAASAIKDKSRNKTQEAINGDVEAAIAEQSAQFDALSEETSSAVASASESARQAEQYLADLQEAITELPDGQAVTAEVADHEVRVTDLEENSATKQEVTTKYGDYSSSSEFYKVITDSSGKILFAIYNTGDVLFGAGVPRQVLTYIDKVIESLIKGSDSTDIDGLQKVVDFLTGVETDSTFVNILDEKVDKVTGKELSSNDYTNEDKEIVSINSQVSNTEYVKVITDSNDKILFSLRKDGSLFISGLREEIIKTVEYAIQNNSSSVENAITLAPSDYNCGLFKINMKPSGILGFNGIDNANLGVIARDMGATLNRLGMYSWAGDAYNMQDVDERLTYITTHYDYAIYRYRVLGLDIMGTFSPFDWYKNAVTKNLTFDEYMSYEIDVIKAFCSRYNSAFTYSPEGETPIVCDMKYFELINEWDANCFGRYGFNWTGQYDSDNQPILDYETGLRNCFKFYKAAYLAIREVRSDIKIVLGGLVSSVPQVLVDLCDIDDDEDGYRFWDFFDIYNYHTYSSVDSMYSEQQAVFNLMQSHSGEGKSSFIDKSVWVSEYGDQTYTTTDEAQAKNLLTKTILLLAGGTECYIPYRLRAREMDILNNSLQAEESFYGIVHNGTHNSVISFMRNDGSDIAISTGDGLSHVVISRSTDVILWVKSNSGIEGRLKDAGLLIKGAGYTVTKVSIIDDKNLPVDQRTETIIYNTPTTFPSSGGSIALNASLFANVMTDSLIKVYVSGVDISNTWDGLQPKIAYQSMVFLLSLLGDEPNNISLYRDSKIWLVAWKDKYGQSVHAMWNSGGTINVNLLCSGRAPLIYNYRGEKLDDVDLTSFELNSLVFIIRAGTITIKNII